MIITNYKPWVIFIKEQQESENRNQVEFIFAVVTKVTMLLIILFEKLNFFYFPN